MPVPSAISDLSTTPASNSPAGSETPSSTDDYLRTLSAFIKQTWDAAQNRTATWCGASGGTANAITLTPSPAITVYGAGQVFRFQAAGTNSGATTVAISGLTPITLQVNGAACVGGEIVSGQWYELVLSSSSVAQLRTTLAPNLTTAINFKRATVAAAATTTPVWLPSNGNVQDWTGVVTITDLPAAPQAGAKREVYPAAGAIMTHGGNISVQGNASVTAAAGDKWIITAVTTTTFDISVVKKDGTPIAPRGQQLFTSSGSWVCPTGVTTAYISGAGGGGGGGGGGSSPGGGGGGAAVLESAQTVVPGNTYTVTIGTGGAGAAGTGATGGTTSFGVLVSLPGGGGGVSANSGGAAGGTGGGSGGPSTQAGYGGGGGGTIFGSGGAPSGGSPSLYGGGGSGTVSGTGTNGADGFILVRW